MAYLRAPVSMHACMCHMALPFVCHMAFASVSKAGVWHLHRYVVTAGQTKQQQSIHAGNKRLAASLQLPDARAGQARDNPCKHAV